MCLEFILRIFANRFVVKNVPIEDKPDSKIIICKYLVLLRLLLYFTRYLYKYRLIIPIILYYIHIFKFRSGSNNNIF